MRISHLSSIVATLSISLLFSPVFAQKNFQEGFVILNSGDTLHGFIDYRNWEKNPQKIKFKSTISAEDVTEYQTNDLSYFKVSNFDSYKKAFILKDISPVDISQSQGNLANRFVEDTVFLRILTEGEKYTLFELIDERPHFFIQPVKGEITELYYRIILNETNSFYSVDYAFRDQLKKIADSNLVIQKKIDKAKYQNKDLTEIVQEINGTQNTRYNAPDLIEKKSTVAFFLGVGGSYNKLTFSGDYNDLSKLEFQGNVSYNIAAGIDLYSLRGLRNLMFRFEASYGNVKYSGEAIVDGFYTGQKEKKDYAIKQTNLSPTILLLYKLFGTSKTRFYVGGGVSYNVSSYSDNEFTVSNLTTGEVKKQQDFLELEKFWPAIQLRIGTIINDKIEIELKGIVAGSFVNYLNITASDNSYGAKIAYRFHK